MFYFDRIGDCFDPLMQFANFEVLGKGFILLDIGFSVQSQGEGGKAVAWVIYGDKDDYPANPGTRIEIKKVRYNASG